MNKNPAENIFPRIEVQNDIYRYVFYVDENDRFVGKMISDEVAEWVENYEIGENPINYRTEKTISLYVAPEIMVLAWPDFEGCGLKQEYLKVRTEKMNELIARLLENRQHLEVRQLEWVILLFNHELGFEYPLRNVVAAVRRFQNHVPVWGVTYTGENGERLYIDLNDELGAMSWKKELQHYIDGGYEQKYLNLLKKIEAMDDPDYYPYDQVYQTISEEDAKLIERMVDNIMHHLRIHVGTDGTYRIHTGMKGQLIALIHCLTEYFGLTVEDDQYLYIGEDSQPMLNPSELTVEIPEDLMIDEEDEQTIIEVKSIYEWYEDYLKHFNAIKKEFFDGSSN